jgi:uncharacterized protein
MSAGNIGQVVSGSLTEGLELRLDPGVSVEDMTQGTYVVVQGRQSVFLGMITDVSLGASNAQLTTAPPDMSDPYIADVMNGTSIYGMLKVQPMLIVDKDAPREEDRRRPVKTIPSHYSPARSASHDEISAVFGEEDDNHFRIGTPLDMDLAVCLDLDRLAERSIGIFGKSGTGKTFLTRLALVGLVQKNKAVTLVFDMQNEYGWAGTSEGSGKAKGLKDLYPSKVALYTLDADSTRRRGGRPDFEVEIGYDQIEPEDIEMLRESMNLNQVQVESIYRIARTHGDRWLQEFLDAEDVDAFAQGLNLHAGTLNVVRRKFDRYLLDLGFVKPTVANDSVRRILDDLQRGISVVLEFGRHGSRLHAYILVANILSRRIYDEYRMRMEKAMGGQGEKPRPLVIAIEEAHKFLNPQVADLTIFGTIAREMRKYNATLLVVDQRPSGIADEVMSQIGTRMTCLLDDEKDIAAVLSGISGASSLRSVLARLESKQQALILGHAVPMPVVIRTRDYGPSTYHEFQYLPVADDNSSPALRSVLGQFE